MEKFSTLFKDSMKEFCGKVSTAIEEIQNTIDTKVKQFVEIKTDLQNARQELRSILLTAEELYTEMGILADSMQTDLEGLDSVLQIIAPEDYPNKEPNSSIVE